MKVKIFVQTNTVEKIKKDKPYFKKALWEHMRSRTLSLVLLMFLATAISLVLGFYEETFAKNPVLVIFIPILMATAGNAGAQTSTVMIRALATGAVKAKDFLKALGREFVIALTTGVIAGALAFGVVYAIYRNINLSLVVWLTLIIAIVLGKTLGVVIPMLIRKLRLDPALISSPLITVLADVGAILFYFILAKALLGL